MCGSSLQHLLGLALHGEGRDAAAAAHVRRAVELRPTAYLYRFNLARVYADRAAGRADLGQKAVDHFLAGLELPVEILQNTFSDRTHCIAHSYGPDPHSC